MPKGGGRHKGAGRRDPRHDGLGTPPPSIILVLPGKRTVNVAREDRIFTMSADDRGVLVAYDDRNVKPIGG